MVSYCSDSCLRLDANISCLDQTAIRPDDPSLAT
jgi:hypothetical protein